MSSNISRRLPIRKLGLVVGTLALFLSLFLSLGVQTSYAGTVEFKDDANVLSSSDESSLRSSASSLPFTVRFYTTNAFTDKNQFINSVSSNAPSTGVIYGISPKLGTSWVVTNGNTGISSSERDSIASSATSSFASGNYKAGFETRFQHPFVCQHQFVRLDQHGFSQQQRWRLPYLRLFDNWHYRPGGY